jgi:hypothetical protein
MTTEKGKGPVAMAAKGGAAVVAEKGKRGRPTAAELEADEGETIIKLKSSDEQIFEVPAKLAKLFKVITDVATRATPTTPSRSPTSTQPPSPRSSSTATTTSG